MRLMKVSTIFLIITLFFSVHLFSQEDALVRSYRLYISKSWDSLYSLRYELLGDNKHSDSYYLRYRIGEAAWMKQDFRTSAVDFGKAFRFNSADSFALQYVQGSLLEQGKLSEAIWINRHIKQLKLRSMKPIRKTRNNYLFLESGLRFSDSENIGDLYFYHGGINLQLSNEFSAYWGWSNLQQSLFQSGEGGTIDLDQQNFLTRLRWQMREDMHLQSYFGYLDIKLNIGDLERVYDQYQFFGLSFHRNFRIVDIDLGMTYSNFYLGDQVGLQGASTWFLGTKRNTAVTAGFLSQTDNGEYSAAVKMALRVRPAKRVWLTGDAYYGNMYNQIEDLGYIPNNAPDLTNWRIRSTITYSASKHFMIYLTGSYENRTEYINEYDYNLSSVFLGLKISPFAGSVSK